MDLMDPRLVSVLGNLDTMTAHCFLTLPEEDRIRMYHYYLDNHLQPGEPTANNFRAAIGECPTFFLADNQVFSEFQIQWLGRVLAAHTFKIESLQCFDKFASLVGEFPNESWPLVRAVISQAHNGPHYTGGGFPIRFPSYMIRQILDLIVQHWNFNSIEELETTEFLTEVVEDSVAPSIVYCCELNKLEEGIAIDLSWEVAYPPGADSYVEFLIGGDLGKLPCFENILFLGKIALLNT